MKRFWALAIAAMLCPPPAASQGDSWLCIPDRATGFSFDEGSREWRSTNFRISNDRFVLRRAKGNEGKDYAWTSKDVVWLLFETGRSHPVISCPNDFVGNQITCFVPFHHFSFNRKSLRFQIIYPIGYVREDPSQDSNADTPNIMIGRCAPI